MKRPRICAVIVNSDVKAVKNVESLVDLFEVRIDLIGAGWRDVAAKLTKPWIVCNRRKEEGGGWRGSEVDRIKEFLSALELKPAIMDIELATESLAAIVPQVKKQAKCLLSYHDFEGTPSLGELVGIVRRQMKAGADIVKVVTTATKFEDNLTALQLIADLRQARVVSFAMGLLGSVSRVLCPLVGGDFTYASIETGKESAAGQITVRDLRKLYEVLKR
ncbi:MAG: type I 3-dehydroquinate dehydratase [Chloroflexota bacterium]